MKWGRGREVCEGGEDRKKIMRKRKYGGIYIYGEIYEGERNQKKCMINGSVPIFLLSNVSIMRN